MMAARTEQQQRTAAWIEIDSAPEAPGFSIRPDGEPIQVSEAAGCETVFWGTLYDREDLQKSIGAAPGANDAELVLRAYLIRGERCFSELRGEFAVVIKDSSKRLVLAARDHLGLHPLFYARAGKHVVLSPSLTAIIRNPKVSSELNRPALADHILHRWPVPEETFFRAVKRVPPACFLSLDSECARIEGYWDPLPPHKPVAWLREDDLPEFDHLLLRAVRRCLSVGNPSIFLSGGLDSVSIAVIAAAECSRAGIPLPLALSLEFPVDSEAPVQRAVARELGLEQVLLNLANAVGPDGWLAAALDLSRKWPAPLLNGWMPAYLTLGAHARAAGRRSILTGVGGDEWLGVAPMLAADYLRDMKLGNWYRLVVSEQRSLRISLLRSLRNSAWDYGFRPLLRDILDAAPGGPLALNALRRLRSVAKPPITSWVAPDPDLRRDLVRRHAAAREASNRIRAGYRSHYLRQCRSYSEHLLPSWENEEYHVEGAQLGVRMLHPFLDPDLIEFLYRVPPELLNKGGRAKGLLRESLERQFPGLGFQKQRKSYAVRCGRTMLLDEGPRAVSRTGGTPALARAGVVDRPRAEAALRSVLEQSNPRKVHLIWTVLNLESWLAGRLN